VGRRAYRNKESGAQREKDMKIGIYLHIPFCRSKCWYCDFFSVAGRKDTLPAYVDSLCREIELYGDPGLEADTVYFGGGTPSLLTADQFEQILGTLRGRFRLAEGAEITCETNPETVDRAKLSAVRGLGVNRLSVGVQSFHDAELRQMERAHDSARAAQCIADARTVGFEDLSIDLITALPGMSLGSLEDNLRQAANFFLEHISAYTLEYHEGTRLDAERAAKKVRPADEEVEKRVYLETADSLGRRGYEHYEVSNFARPGRRCRHNLKYWRHEPYLGFGASAHGFAENRRYWNHPDLDRYLEDLSAGRKPLAGEEELDGRQLALERLMLGLRTADGAVWTQRDLPRDVPKRFVVRHGDRIALTREGFALYDTIAEAFARAMA